MNTNDIIYQTVSMHRGSTLLACEANSVPINACRAKSSPTRRCIRATRFQQRGTPRGQVFPNGRWLLGPRVPLRLHGTCQFVAPRLAQRRRYW